MSFPCTKCGKCCRHLHLNALYRDLDRGDGVCRYLDGNLCSIYSIRPLKCRVDDAYEKYFQHQMTLEEYYNLNKKMCKQLNNL